MNRICKISPQLHALLVIVGSRKKTNLLQVNHHMVVEYLDDNNRSIIFLVL